MRGLVSPSSGRPLREEGPHTLTDGDERWPIVDGIAYLRTGREALVARVLAALDRGDPEGALVALLADQDEWWDGPAPSDDKLRRLIHSRDQLSLREAMDCLAFGRVGDYFAHRWSDPTFMAGMALLDAHWTAPESAFELACGIGHYLRELAGRGVDVTGGDVVFSKLWLARHWVAPSASLVCFDAASTWPLVERGFDLVLCHDAFYFLEPKPHVLGALRSLVRQGGSLALAHIHNRDTLNLSPGAGVSFDEIAAAFPEAVVYDDAELTRAAANGAEPRGEAVEELRHVDAFSLHEGGMARHPPSAADPTGLRLNPLYVRSDGGYDVAWPSERYKGEYAAMSTYRHRIDGNPQPDAAAVRRREFLDLPDRW